MDELLAEVWYTVASLNLQTHPDALPPFPCTGQTGILGSIIWSCPHTSALACEVHVITVKMGKSKLKLSSCQDSKHNTTLIVPAISPFLGHSFSVGTGWALENDNRLL